MTLTKSDTFKKKYHKLYKLYDKQLKEAHKVSYREFLNPMDYFIKYLKFMRDYYILTSDKKDTMSSIKIASLTAAISEITDYSACIEKYFDVDLAKVDVHPKDGKSYMEAMTNYLEDSQKHWSTFWALVSTNMQNWMELGDILDGTDI